MPVSMYLEAYADPHLEHRNHNMRNLPMPGIHMDESLGWHVK